MSERDPRLYCEDILESGSAILDFVKGLSFEDFCDDRKTCEPASLKSDIMCTIFLTKKSPYDIKIVLHPEVKINIFSWRVQQENGRFCHLSRKEEER